MQLLGELGVENGQQPVVHSLHVCLWIGRSIGRHRCLLCQHLACRQKGNINQTQQQVSFTLGTCAD